MKNIFIPIKRRPRCSHKNCNEPRQLMGNYSKKTGYPFFRKVCSHHHSLNVGKKHGMKSLIQVVAAKRGMSVSEYSRSLAVARAKKAGMTVQDYLNQQHPYRKYRKTYCENRDMRLGFKCRYKIMMPAQLHVDHKNGNPDDDRPKNLQTLCANCHTFKTFKNKDWRSPGRKALHLSH